MNQSRRLERLEQTAQSQISAAWETFVEASADVIAHIAQHGRAEHRAMLSDHAILTIGFDVLTQLIDDAIAAGEVPDEMARRLVDSTHAVEARRKSNPRAFDTFMASRPS